MDEARVLHSILVLLLDISAHFTLHHLISYLPHRRAVWPNRVVTTAPQPLLPHVPLLYMYVRIPAAGHKAEGDSP